MIILLLSNVSVRFDPGKEFKKVGPPIETEKFSFQNDRDPKHMSAFTRNWLQKHDRSVLAWVG